MSIFWDKFKQEIADLREREHAISPEVENFQRDFQERADTAERLFREKERLEEDVRNAGKFSKQ